MQGGLDARPAVVGEEPKVHAAGGQRGDDGLGAGPRAGRRGGRDLEVVDDLASRPLEPGRVPAEVPCLRRGLGDAREDRLEHGGDAEGLEERGEPEADLLDVHGEGEQGPVHVEDDGGAGPRHPKTPGYLSKSATLRTSTGPQSSVRTQVRPSGTTSYGSRGSQPRSSPAATQTSSHGKLKPASV